MLYTAIDEFVIDLTQYVALGIDVIALMVIAIAAARAVTLYVSRAHFGKDSRGMEEIRLIQGRSLVLGLEFLIGADILRTAVAPSWTSIGQLGAIILLRTLLDFFLERDIRELSHATEKEERSDDNRPR